MHFLAPFSFINIDTMERDRFDCVTLIAKQLLTLEKKEITKEEKKTLCEKKMRHNDVSRERFVFTIRANVC